MSVIRMMHGLMGASSASPDAHVGWRIYVQAVDGGTAVSVTTLEFRSVVDQEQQNTGGTAIASAVYAAGYEASRAFDGKGSTFWASPVGLPQWLGYVFPNPVSVAQIAIRARPSQTFGQSPATFRIQYSDNPLAGSPVWADAWTVTGSVNWIDSQTRGFARP